MQNPVSRLVSDAIDLFEYQVRKRRRNMKEREKISQTPD